MEPTSHEIRIEKLIKVFDLMFSSLESLTADDVKYIVKRSFYAGRKAGYLECKQVVESSYKAKFKGERRPANKVQETTTPDGHFIDDPLAVANAKPDFSNICNIKFDED